MVPEEDGSVQERQRPELPLQVRDYDNRFHNISVYSVNLTTWDIGLVNTLISTEYLLAEKN